MLMTARTGIFSDTGDTFLKHTVCRKEDSLELGCLKS